MTTILLTVYLTGAGLTTIGSGVLWFLGCMLSGRFCQPEFLFYGLCFAVIWPLIPFIILYKVLTFKFK